MLTKIGLRNFKAFERLSLELRPITVFLGPNNSGKSSILAAIRVLSQTSTSFDSNVSMLLNGTFGDFGTYRDIVYGQRRNRTLEIELEVKPTAEMPTPSIVAFTCGIKLEYKYRPTLKEIVINRLELTREGKHLLTTVYSEETQKQTLLKISSRSVPPPLRPAFSRHLRIQHFIPSYPFFLISTERGERSKLKEFLGENAEKNVRRANRIARAIDNALRGIEYVGAMRLPPSRTFLFSGERRKRVGASGEHSIGIMVMDSLQRGIRSKNIRAGVVEWLRKAGIASDLQAEPLSDRYFEIRIQHPTTGEFANFADVGYGSSQVIPVLVGGLNLSVGDTFLVEQPEIHLHPRAQSELGDFFLQLHQNRVQSIIETHSEHLILRLQQHVAAGRIKNPDIVIYYVCPRDAKKHVFKMELDNQGRFRDPWPEGFFPERLKEATALARIRSQQGTEC